MLLKLESTFHSNDESRRFHCCSTVRIQRLLTSVLKQRPKRCYLPSSPSSSPNSLPNKPKRDSDSSLKHFPSSVPHCHCSDHRCTWFGFGGGGCRHTGFGILSRQETSEMETCALFYLCPSPIMQSTRRNRGAASRRAPKHHCDFEITAGSELRGVNAQHLDVNTRRVPRFKVRVVFPLFKFEADTIRGSGNS